MLVIGDKSNVFFFWAKEKAKKCLPLQVKCYAFNEVKNTSFVMLPMRLHTTGIAFSKVTKTVSDWMVVKECVSKLLLCTKRKRSGYPNRFRFQNHDVLT